MHHIFLWSRNEHFYMQSHVHKGECFNSYKLQNGRIGDYPVLGLSNGGLPNGIASE